MSRHWVVSVVCFDGIFVFTDAVIESAFYATHVETSTGAGETVHYIQCVVLQLMKSLCW